MRRSREDKALPGRAWEGGNIISDLLRPLACRPRPPRQQVVGATRHGFVGRTHRSAPTQTGRGSGVGATGRPPLPDYIFFNRLSHREAGGFGRGLSRSKAVERPLPGPPGRENHGQGAHAAWPKAVGRPGSSAEADKPARGGQARQKLNRGRPGGARRAELAGHKSVLSAILVMKSEFCLRLITCGLSDVLF